MVLLPREFLEWNYFARRKLLEETLLGGIKDVNRFFLEFTRHNPVLCTAAIGEDGVIEVNGKVVGIGYVVKEKYLGEVIREFEEHLRATDEKYVECRGDKVKLNELYKEHSRRGLKLLLKNIYLEREKAEEKMDFEKLATIELALRIPHSSKHTWNLVKKSSKACLVFFQPPSVSFEIKGEISIHLDDKYHKYVNLVHDAYHYTPPEKRGNRPVYIFHVSEIYDNSPTPRGFGRKIT
ncbi:MAG: hypothetical protein J7L38_00810 [Thermoproteales archaeon]|nr:hypothetical protein [Thermoproteales archaeon]RLE66540.1 MAG: hypothetical protein DRJ47_02390 [Thermoprotei archaeon]